MPEIVRNFHMAPSVRHYYNVSFGVGAHRRNDQLDVLLVQFLLNQIEAQQGGRFINPPLVTDGLFGPKTRAAIGAFQASWNRGPGTHKPRLDEDRVVSPGRGRTRPGNRTWTILALNALAGNQIGGGIDMYCRLHTHPECPPRLQSFFASAPGRVPPSAVPRLARAGSGPVGSTLADRLGTPPASSLADRLAAPPVGERSRARLRTTTPRPYDRTDPGVQWATRIMRPGRDMFTDYEWSEIMEMMQGTGDWSTTERWTLLKQIVDFTLGEPFLSGLPDLSVRDAQELMRQNAALGGFPRLRPRRH